MIEQYRKSELAAFDYPSLELHPITVLSGTTRPTSTFNIQNIPKSMHVPQETIVMANVLAGNFQVVDPLMIEKIRRAGKEIMVIQLPRSSETVLREVAGSGTAFDKMMVNATDVIAGLRNPNTGVSVDISESTSVYSRIASVARQSVGRSQQIAEADALRRLIEENTRTIDNLKLKQEKLRVDTEVMLAAQLTEDRLAEKLEVADKIKQLNALVEELSALTKDPTLTASMAVKKARAQKKSNSDFESLLSSLPKDE